MATILELTQMSENLNNVGSPTPTVGSSLAGLSGWTVVETSAQVSGQYWGAGYFGVVYRNTVTGEIYDLDFCRQAEQRALRMGTWAISAIHTSAGKLGSPGWRQAYRTYLEKYDEA